MFLKIFNLKYLGWNCDEAELIYFKYVHCPRGDVVVLVQAYWVFTALISALYVTRYP